MIIYMQITYDQAIATIKYRWLENGVRHRANVYVLDRTKAKAEMRIGDEQTYQRVKLIFAYMIPQEGVAYLRKDKLLVETFIYERQRQLRFYKKYSEISFFQFSQSTTELKEFFAKEPELLSSYEAIFYQLNHHHHLHNYREPIGFELIKARLFHTILSASKEGGVATIDCLDYLFRLAKCLPKYGEKSHSAQIVLESSGLIKQVDDAWVITSKQLKRYLLSYFVFNEVQYLDADLQQYKQMISKQNVKEASVYSIHDLSTKCRKLL